MAAVGNFLIVSSTLWLPERYIPVLPFLHSFLFLFLRMYARNLVSFSPLVPWVFSFTLCGSFAPFSVPLYFSPRVLVTFLAECGLTFLCGTMLVRAAVFSLTCMSCPRSFVFLRFFFFKVLVPLFVFCCCCGNIVNPSSLNLGAFLILGICVRLRILSCGFANFHLRP